jgi:hypothetical protein
VRALGLNGSLHPLPQIIGQQLRARGNRRRRSAGSGCATLTLRQRLLAFLLAHTMTPQCGAHCGKARTAQYRAAYDRRPFKSDRKL